MTPYEKAQEIYEQHGLDLESDVLEYAKVGHVHITDRYVLIGRRVGDGWFVRLAIGEGCLMKFIDLMPYELPLIGWARCVRGRWDVAWHSTERVIRILNYENTKHI